MTPSSNKIAEWLSEANSIKAQQDEINVYVWLNIHHGHQLTEPYQKFILITIKPTIFADSTSFDMLKDKIIAEGNKWNRPVMLDSILFDIPFKNYCLGFDKIEGGEEAFKDQIIAEWNSEYNLIKSQQDNKRNRVNRVEGSISEAPENVKKLQGDMLVFLSNNDILRILKQEYLYFVNMMIDFIKVDINRPISTKLTSVLYSTTHHLMMDDTKTIQEKVMDNENMLSNNVYKMFLKLRTAKSQEKINHHATFLQIYNSVIEDVMVNDVTSTTRYKSRVFIAFINRCAIRGFSGESGVTQDTNMLLYCYDFYNTYIDKHGEKS